MLRREGKKSSVGRGVNSFGEYGQFTKEVCMTAQMEILQRGARTQRSVLERERLKLEMERIRHAGHRVRVTQGI